MNDCVIDRYNDVSRYCWSYAEGDHFVGSIDDEDQDHCSTWAKILGVDRRIDSGFAVDLSTDVDLETGVWWIRSINRSPQMFLNQCSHSLQPSSTELLSTLLCSVSFFVYSSSLRLSVHVWKLLRSSSPIWLCARVYLLYVPHCSLSFHFLFKKYIIYILQLLSFFIGWIFRGLRSNERKDSVRGRCM